MPPEFISVFWYLSIHIRFYKECCLFQSLIFNLSAYGLNSLLNKTWNKSLFTNIYYYGLLSLYYTKQPLLSRILYNLCEWDSHFLFVWKLIISNNTSIFLIIFTLFLSKKSTHFWMLSIFLFGLSQWKHLIFSSLCSLRLVFLLRTLFVNISSCILHSK